MDEGKQIILQMKYVRIIECIAGRLQVSLEKAMDIFYSSQTMQLIQDGIADLHCRSDEYLAGEIIAEYREEGHEIRDIVNEVTEEGFLGRRNNG